MLYSNDRQFNGTATDKAEWSGFDTDRGRDYGSEPTSMNGINHRAFCGFDRSAGDTSLQGLLPEVINSIHGFD